MLRHLLLVLGLLLAACGDSGDSAADLGQANQLTAEDVAARGDYCCYDNGAASSDSPAACAKSATGCVWSQTYNNVDASGRGQMCGYLACR
jgi:hypothetical protein